ECRVHASEEVLEELGDLRGPDVRHRNELLDDRAVQGDDRLEAVLGEAADDLGCVVDVPFGVSGVETLRRVADENIDPRHVAVVAESGYDHFLRPTATRG